MQQLPVIISEIKSRVVMCNLLRRLRRDFQLRGCLRVGPERPDATTCAAVVSGRPAGGGVMVMLALGEDQGANFKESCINDCHAYSITKYVYLC